MSKALLTAALLACALAWAGERQVTVLFTGDNRAEVAPCGCRNKPTGGLARRKTVLAPVKNALVFDAGNALFKTTAPPTAEEKQRASFVLRTMGRTGTKVLVVGERDLPGGLDFLQAEAKAAGVTLLSANTTLDGKRPFEGSKVLAVGGAKVALIGVSGGALGALKAGGALEAVNAELTALGPRDVTLVVAALPRGEAVELAGALTGRVDGVVQSSNGLGGQQPAMRLPSGMYLFGAGQLGEGFGRLVYSLDGTGPFVDSADLSPERAYMMSLDLQATQLEDRLAETKDPVALREGKRELASLKARRDEFKKALAAGPPRGTRSFTFDWLLMGPEVRDDPTIKAEALKFEPTYAGNR